VTTPETTATNDPEKQKQGVANLAELIDLAVSGRLYSLF